jgi:hypothetical protein
MRALTKCLMCGLDLGPYAETHCPQCGVSLASKPVMAAGTRLLDLAITVSGTLFVFGSVFVFASYMCSSSPAELYKGAPYHAATFRVISVQFSHSAATDIPSYTAASAVGIVEGQKESMDLLPYLQSPPGSWEELIDEVREGTVIPVYLFPTLRGENHIQLIQEVPAAEDSQK